jgi:hypothetical protein
MSHLDNHRADGKGLQNSLDLSSGDCGKDKASGFCKVAYYGDVSFSNDEYTSHRPVNRCQCSSTEPKKSWLANYRKADKGATDEDFVSEWVCHSSQLAPSIEFSSYLAINDIRKSEISAGA